MWFSRKDYEKGLVLKYIETLLEISNKSSDSMLDILISGDGECISVDTNKVYMNNNMCNSKYVLLDEGDEVYTEIYLPDGTYQWVPKNYDRDEFIKEWLNANPGWEKNSYGTWVNKEENERLKKELLEDTEARG